MGRIFVVITIFVLGAVAVPQQKTAEGDPCKDPMTQVQTNLCSRGDYEKADTEMNLAFKQLIQELAGFETNHSPKFEEAQSLWLKYRDANCESEADIYKGGSIRPTIYYSCLAALTRERTNRIKLFLDEIKAE
jgi:uncharacterized protein YecT (DUF1311 family)